MTARTNDPFTPTNRDLLATEDAGLSHDHAVVVSWADKEWHEIRDMFVLDHLDEDTAVDVLTGHGKALGLGRHHLIPARFDHLLGSEHSPIRRRWALFTRHHPECVWVTGHGEHCDCVSDVDWHVDYGPAVTADTPGAVPVTVLEP